MERLWQDLRYGVRALGKQPDFTLVAVAVLALGIGANTAIFSLTHQVLLRSLPVREPERLVILSSPGPKQGHTNSDTHDGAESFSYPMYQDLDGRNEVFSGLLGRFAVSLNVAARGQTERAAGELVSGNYFEVLGVRAAVGRTFTRDDDRAPGAHPVAVLSHGFWTRRFGSDPGVLNQPMVVNGHSLTVVGVTEPGFAGVQLGQQPDLFIPVTMKAHMTPNWDGLSDRKDYWLNLLGRLKPGLTREQAEAGLGPLYRGLLETEAPLQQGLSQATMERFLSKKILLAEGSRGRTILQSDTRTPLLTLMGMVGLVLLIACANVAGLLIARGAARRKEIAVRLALGAGRWRLVRQLLVESVVLSLAGGLLGVLVARWALAALLHWMPAEDDLSNLAVGLDYTRLAFNFGLAILTGVVFGLAPALKATRTDLVTALKDQGAGAGVSGSHARFRKGLIVAEVALTMVLLVAAGLFARSLYNLRVVDAGVRADHLLTFSVALGLSGYDPARAVALFGRMEEALAAVPGVRAVSGAEIPIFANSNMGSNLTVEGHTPAEGEDTHTFRNQVGPGYFSTLGVPLLVGREFTRQDTAQSQKVAVVSETLARHYFGDGNPVGRRLAFGRRQGRPPDIEIVGVVKDSKHSNLRSQAQRFVYTPYTQNPQIGNLTFYVRTAGEPEAAAGALRREVARLDANLPVYALRTMREQINNSIAGDRLMAALSAAFGLLAALLAAVGIYGVMSYTVTQSTREIGIRVALGARRRDVLRLIVGQGMALAGAGAVIGLAAALAVTRLLASLLYGVGAADPLTFAAITLLLAGVAFVACYLPARRATRVDPMVALRYE